MLEKRQMVTLMKIIDSLGDGDKKGQKHSWKDMSSSHFEHSFHSGGNLAGDESHCAILQHREIICLF